MFTRLVIKANAFGAEWVVTWLLSSLLNAFMTYVAAIAGMQDLLTTVEALHSHHGGGSIFPDSELTLTQAGSPTKQRGLLLSIAVGAYLYVGPCLHDTLGTD